MAPVVLIHGLFGWGEERPLFGLGPTYFPLQHLRKLWPHGPVVAVDVGIASSDHDRACEAFAQLLGQRTDYGEARTHECDHVQHGTIYESGLLEDWCASNPIHLIGHSFGGNTAVALFNLIAEDFWKVGTGPDWVVSVTCICSPLRGCNLPSMFGLEPPSTEDAGAISSQQEELGGLMGKMAVTLFHWFLKLQERFPTLLRPFFDARMHQWRAHRLSVRNAEARMLRTASETARPARGDPESLRKHFRNLSKTRLIAVVAGSLDPISPSTFMRSFFAPIAGLMSAGSFLMLLMLWRWRHRLRERLAALPPGVARRLVLLLLLWSAVSPMVMAAVLCSPRLRQQRAAMGAWLQDTILEHCRPLLHGWLMRPLLRLSSHALPQHGTALVPTGSAAMMNVGTESSLPDGMIDLISQYGLEAPTIEHVTVLPNAKTRAKLKHLMGSSGSSSRTPERPDQRQRRRGKQSAVVAATRPVASADSDSEELDPEDLEGRPMRLGKWHVIHVPEADQCLGTWLDPHHTRDMYTTLFFLLQSCTLLRRPSSLRDFT